MSFPRRLIPTLVVAAVLVPWLLARAVAPAGASPYEPTRHAIPGDNVAIYNLVGSVELARGDGPSVVAEITFAGKDAARLIVAKGPIGERQTLRVIYPDDHIILREFGDHTTSTFRVKDDGTFSGEDRERSGHKVTINGRGHGMEASANMRIFVPVGRKLAVYWGHGKALVSRVDADLTLDGASMPVDASDFRGALQVDVGSGAVHLERGEAEISVDTGSGEVSLKRVHGRQLVVDTGSGDVTGQDVNAEMLSIDTGSGRIFLERAKGKRVSLDTGSGGVTVTLTGDLQTLAIDSGSGDVSVTVPKALGARLSVETGSGGIETNLKMETRLRKRDKLVGTLGDGSGTIAIETGSGTVSIRQEGL